MPSPSTRASRLPEPFPVYAEVGQGRPLVFVHGSNTDHRIWHEASQVLAPSHRVIALTQRYFGPAPWPDDGQGFSIDGHAAVLAEFIMRLKLEDLILVGWSYGAAVCLAMAAAHPRLATQLILYEPAVITFVTDTDDAKAAADDRVRMTTAAREAADHGDPQRAVRCFMDGVDDRDDGFATLPPSVQHIMLDNARMLPLLFAAPPPRLTSEHLAKIETPAVVARGDHTRTFYRVAADTAARSLPRAELVIVPDATHLFPVRDPVRFAHVVRRATAGDPRTTSQEPS